MQTEYDAESYSNASFVELSPDAYIKTNDAGVIESANQAAERLLGLPRNILKGKPLALFVDKRDLRSFYRPVVRIRREFTERVDNLQIKLKSIEGASVCSAISVAVIRDSSGRAQKLCWFIRDITKQVEQAEEIQHLNQELQSRLRDLSVARDQAMDADRTKSQFIANISHELRTPLNGVVGMTDILLSSSLDADQLESASIIRDSAKHILALVEDVLDLSKMDVGMVGLRYADFNVVTSLEDTVRTLSEAAQQKGLSLMTYIDPRVPQEIHGDSLRISQVLLNLLSNAIKFTEQGEVCLKVTVSEDLEKIRFYVVDTGVGLSKLEVGRLFKPFSQVDSSNTRGHGGTGLGLFISKKLVELMGGQIGVFSNRGKGSTFWFTLPLTVGAKNTATLILSGLDSKTALVVSSHSQCVSIITRYIRDWGVKCVAASSPSAAEAFIPVVQCGAVIVDVASPDSGVRAWLKKSIESGSLRQKQLIVVANTKDEALMAAGSVSGCTYLSKPVRASELFECLRRGANPNTLHMQPNRLEDKNSARTWHRSVSQSEGNHRVLVADDNAINQKVMALLLEKLGFGCDFVWNGEEAVHKFSHGTYALILMDCQMPTMDGYEATQRIRRHEALTGGHVPIVAFTAGAMPEDRQKCIDAGMDDYLSKPVTLDKLKTVVLQWLTNSTTDKVESR